MPAHRSGVHADPPDGRNFPLMVPRDSRTERMMRSSAPMLERAEIADDVVRAIREEFPWTAANEG